MGGHGDDRGVAAGLLLAGANGGGRLQPVHVGHLHVHQHQVEGLRLPGGNRLLAVVGHGDRVALALEQAHGQLLVDQAVFGQQHAHAADRLGLSGFDFRGAYVGQGEPRGEVKGAPPAHAAFDPDPPAHALHQPGGDGQAQSRAAVLAPGGIVGLLEHLEDHAQLVLGDADSGVGDGEVEHGFVFRLRLGGHVEDHFALLGELEGVADEVDDDLAQAAGIAGQALRYVGVDMTGQLQPLFVCPEGQRPHRVAEMLAEIEGDTFEVDPAGLDLGEVEDVVDHQ